MLDIEHSLGGLMTHYIGILYVKSLLASQNRLMKADYASYLLLILKLRH
jgi:hypothetical protein